MIGTHFSSPVLALSMSTTNVRRNNDAFDVKLGRAQLRNVPVRPWSQSRNHSRSPADINAKHGIAQREFLAIVWPVSLLVSHLNGTVLTVRLDHESLKWIVDLIDFNNGLATWSIQLFQFMFDAVYREGKKASPRMRFPAFVQLMKRQFPYTLTYFHF